MIVTQGPPFWLRSNLGTVVGCEKKGWSPNLILKVTLAFQNCIYLHELDYSQTIIITLKVSK